MSEIRANTVSNAAGTGPVTLTGQYAAKAWVNFNGTGTVAIRQSGNVSSITDNNTGDYTTNFTTAMVDVNYSALVTADGNKSGVDANSAGVHPSSLTVNSFGVGTHNANNGAADYSNVMCSVFR